MTSRILERLMGTDCQIPFGSKCTVIYFPGLISFHDCDHLPKLDCSVLIMDTYCTNGFLYVKINFQFCVKILPPTLNRNSYFLVWFEPFYHN